MRRALLIAIAIVAPRVARAQPADAVALLPLDADQRLEIYGQPVAGEIARTLVGGGIDVVVVGPKAAVPERARLIVDGTITAGKGDAVTLTVRVRDPRDGTVLETVPATAAALTSIDRAAADVSEHVLPLVKKHLAALHAAGNDPSARATTLSVTVPAQPRPLLAAIVAAPGAAGGGELRTALDAAFADYAKAHARTVQAASGVVTSRAFGIAAGGGADLGIALEVLAYTVEPGLIPMAHARVRVRIVTPGKIDFDRTVVTDTILGDRNMPPATLAARTAREVLAIVQPNLRRAVPAWR